VVRKLIEWAVANPLIVLVLALALTAAGTYAFVKVNVEAYPDPAPAIIEVVAQYPGASAEEVERLVTIPLEVALAGMPHLTYTRSKSLAGLSHLRNQFEYGVDYFAARQEVINRLAFVTGLPSGVNPQISPFTPTGELIRYTVSNPKSHAGREIYTLNDLKALQDWTLDREFRRLPRIAGLTSFGGTVKRYEVRPDPEQLKRYGITLAQFSSAISSSNANTGAGYLVQGGTAVNVRGIGLFGRGLDPMQHAMTLRHARLAATHLRKAEAERIEDIRKIVVASVNNVPVRVRDLVVKKDGEQGVLVSHQPRLGKVSVSRPVRDAQGNLVLDARGNVVYDDQDDTVQGVLLMRKNEHTLPSLEAVKAKVDELNNTPGRLLPGTKIELHFDLTGLLHVTRETVQENLLLGMVLVGVILLMFLSNVRSALIVAINIPLALLFAFSVLFLRGKSANLLSIGAVDFGIIVDSSVIIVENIYRHVSSGEGHDLPLKDRIIRACHEIERPLFFSTAIMVCAFIPLFTMRGPEGQIFGPMADTYAFALGGALLLALTVAPVLCLLFFKDLKPTPDNFFVRWLRAGYLRQLERCLNHRLLTLTFFGTLIAITVAALPQLGREFMPELEEGNLYVRGTFPVNVSLEEAADKARSARAVIRQYPEVALVASQVGRPDDGTDPTGFYNVEFSIPLRPEKEWPKETEQTGWRARLFGPKRARSKPELVKAMNEELARSIPGVDWNFSQYIRDNVMESLSGVKGDNSVKIIGPDLNELERLAELVKAKLDSLHGVENVGVFRITGQPNLEFTVDRQKCERWNVSVKDVETAIQVAVGGQAFSQMIEGEKTFDIALRWPEHLRGSEQAILNIPVDVSGNTVTPVNSPGLPATPVSGQTGGVSPSSTAMTLPALVGSLFNGAFNNVTATPRLRMRQLVTAVNSAGEPVHDAAARMIYALRWLLDSRDPAVKSATAAAIRPFESALRPFLDKIDPPGRQEGEKIEIPGKMALEGLQAHSKQKVRDAVEEARRRADDAPMGTYLRTGASTIYREQGKRLIAVKFSVNNTRRDLASAVAEAQATIDPLMPPGYQAEWSGEFRQMEEAEARLRYWIPASLALIFLLLYLAFRNLLDVLTALSNVVAICLGGIWALLLTGNNFSISAAVGFISIFGVAIMDGLLLISYFNQMRAQGLPLREAILQGGQKRVRPMMMTALTAIFGLLPAALSTRIGAQTQRPLAIVVVGGMITELLLTRYLMPVLYSFYGHREPPEEAGSMAH
jgi:cobalt-zinc-cadmium resistance protein CzcA